jgi:hypothetical protein
MFKGYSEKVRSVHWLAAALSIVETKVWEICVSQLGRMCARCYPMGINNATHLWGLHLMGTSALAWYLGCKPTLKDRLTKNTLLFLKQRGELIFCVCAGPRKK